MPACRAAPTDRQEQRRAAARARSWDVRGDGRTACAAAWGLFYDTLPGQGDFFQNGTLAPPFQPLTEVNYPLHVDRRRRSRTRWPA